MSKKTVKGPKYYFLDKEKLRRSSERTSDLLERMYESFQNFIEARDVFTKDSYIEFTNLEARAGITDKLIKKVKVSIEKLRTLYFARMADIYQTTIEEFIDDGK